MTSLTYGRATKSRSQPYYPRHGTLANVEEVQRYEVYRFLTSAFDTDVSFLRATECITAASRVPPQLAMTTGAHDTKQLRQTDTYLVHVHLHAVASQLNIIIILLTYTFFTHIERQYKEKIRTNQGLLASTYKARPFNILKNKERDLCFFLPLKSVRLYL